MEDQHTPSLFKNLTLKQGYIIALGLILMIATLKFAAMEVLVVKQDGAAVVINVSGRQRMLSQRTAFFASAFVKADSQQARTALRPDLLKTINEFEENHKDLIEGDAERGLPALNNQEIYDVYYNQDPALDNLVKQYIQTVRIILAQEGQGPKAETALVTIFEIGPSILLKQLNAVVQLHETKARADVEFISSLQRLFWLITLIVLVLEGLFLFRPMERRIKDNIAVLQKREQKIKDQFEELERFTYIASHDLQEPLRKIIGFTERLEMALKDKLSDKEQTYMNFISAGALHMRELVRGLHTYARISAAEDDLEEIEVEKAIRQALKGLEEKIQQDNAKINYHDLPTIIYNKTMLIQIFEDLIGNAIKYKGANNPVIDISAEDVDRNWVFCISDNGLGIDEKFFERIFVMFQRLHRKEDISGTGLGLAIVKKIVERHGGEIWVKSNEGNGSQFYFTVPKEI